MSCVWFAFRFGVLRLCWGVERCLWIQRAAKQTLIPCPCCQTLPQNLCCGSGKRRPHPLSFPVACQPHQHFHKATTAVHCPAQRTVFMKILSYLRRTGIRTRLVASFAGMTILLTLFLVEAVGVLASRQLKNDIGKNLSELAFQAVDKLDRGMYERYREVQLMAARAELADPRIPSEK